MPSCIVSAAPPATIAAAAFNNDNVTPRTALAAEDAFHDGRICGGIAALNLRGRYREYSEVFGRDRIGRDLTFLQFPNRRRCTDGNFIHTVFPANHKCMFACPAPEVRSPQGPSTIIDETPTTWNRGRAGFESGPMMLNTVRIPSCVRAGMTCFIEAVKTLRKQKADTDVGNRLAQPI